MTKPDVSTGDIVLVPFPFSDLKNQKLRPALVVSSQIVNDRESDVTLVFISSVVPLDHEPYECIFKKSHADFKQSGLKKESVFKMHKIATVEKRLIKNRLGLLGKTIRKELSVILPKAIHL